MMPRFTLISLVTWVFLTVGCGEREHAPYFFPKQHDASDDPDPTDASAPDASTDADVSDAGRPAKGVVITGGEQGHVGEACGDFSSGTAYAFIRDEKLGTSFVSLATDPENAPECGYLLGHVVGNDVGIHIPDVRIRPTDGKLLYLREGSIYEYVPDEAGAASPLYNDILVPLTNKCESKTPGTGALSGFLFKPDGSIVYGCSNPKGLYTAQGEKLAETDSTQDLVVDGAGKMIVHGAGLDSKGYLAQTGTTISSLVWDHGVARPLRISPLEKELEYCLENFSLFAARPLAQDFLVVLRDRCGIQLWRTHADTIELLGHYLKASGEVFVDLGITTFGYLTWDGTLFFNANLRLGVLDTVQCPGTICAMKPTAGRATVQVSVVAPPSSSLQLFDFVRQRRSVHDFF